MLLETKAPRANLHYRPSVNFSVGHFFWKSWIHPSPVEGTAITLPIKLVLFLEAHHSPSETVLV